MKLGKRLAHAFALSGTSAPQVSRATGVPAATINALLRRDSDRSQYAQQLVEALNPTRVNIDWVLTGRGNPEPEPQHRTVANNELQVAMPSQQALNAAAPAHSATMLHLPRLAVAAIGSGERRQYVAAAIDSQTLELPASWADVTPSNSTSLCWSQMEDESMTGAIPLGARYVVDTKEKGGEVGVPKALYSIVLRNTGVEQVRYLQWNEDGTATISAANDSERAYRAPSHDYLILGRVTLFIAFPSKS